MSCDASNEHTRALIQALIYFTERVSKLLRVLELRDAVLIGHSFGNYFSQLKNRPDIHRCLGALIALHLATNAQVSVSKLVLISPVGLPARERHDYCGPSISSNPARKSTFERIADRALVQLWSHTRVTPLGVARLAGPFLRPVVQRFIRKSKYFTMESPDFQQAFADHMYLQVKHKSSVEYLIGYCVGEQIVQPSWTTS